MTKSKYLLNRLLQIPISLLIISLLVFFLIHLTPGDPVELALPPGASKELANQIRHQLGMDRPLHEQYAHWLLNALQGDLGKSIQTGERVTEMLMDRLPVTVILATTATVISVLVSLIGVIAAVRFHRKTDYAVMLFSTIGISVPNFFAGILLIILFGVLWRVLPISGFVNPLKDPIEGIRHLAMPAFSLGLLYAALHTRMVRSSMLDIINQDFIRTARAKGLREYQVILRHGLRNALLPVITVVGMSYAYMLGGSIIIEQVFAIPGIGRLLIIAVNSRDFPVIQGVLLMVGMTFLLINLLTDLLYGFIDPRIKY